MISVLAFVLPLAVRQTGASPLDQPLLGSWIGTLEYRDYSDNSREKLGTLLRVFKDKTTGRLVLRYVYDDGPHKVVQDEDDVEVDAAKATYAVYSADGKEASRYAITGLDHLSNLGFGKIILVGKATENGAPVDIRETLTIEPERFRILRESRLQGQGFLFRHEFQFTRVDTPKKK